MIKTILFYVNHVIDYSIYNRFRKQMMLIPKFSGPIRIAQKYLKQLPLNQLHHVIFPHQNSSDLDK